MHIKLTNGIPENYSIGELRRDNPQVSFPKNIPIKTLAEYEVYPLNPVSRPEYDYATERVEEDIATLVNNEWLQSWKIVSLTSDEKAHRSNVRSLDVRSERNQLLAECDWTQLPDAQVDINEWAGYRKALRDITLQDGFPFNVQWPTQRPQS